MATSGSPLTHFHVQRGEEVEESAKDNVRVTVTLEDVSKFEATGRNLRLGGSPSVDPSTT